MRSLPLPHLPPFDALPPGWSPPAPTPRPKSGADRVKTELCLRMLRAEVRIMEAVAEVASTHVCDPRWLKAAARKECCAAELLRALECCEGGDGDRRGDGDEAPVFEGDNLKPFLDLLEKHNEKKEMLRQWRTDFGTIAGQLAEFVKESLGEGYAGTVYPHVRPEGVEIDGLPHACLLDVNHLKRVFSHPRGGAGAGPSVFDPWHGRWRGKWTSGEEEERNFEAFHVWDSTRRIENDDDGEQQYLQPVTQSTRRFIGKDEIDGDPQRPGVQPPPDADLAINVYGSRCGVTGWVVKPDRTPGDGQDQTQVLPHIGYRIAPGVLVWIAQIHHPDCTPWGENEPFLIFFEWVDENGNYGILGKRFRLRRTGSGDINSGDPIDPVEPTEADPHGYPNERHGGIYRRS